MHEVNCSLAGDARCIRETCAPERGNETIRYISRPAPTDYPSIRCLAAIESASYYATGAVPIPRGAMSFALPSIPAILSDRALQKYHSCIHR